MDYLLEVSLLSYCVSGVTHPEEESYAAFKQRENW